MLRKRRLMSRLPTLLGSSRQALFQSLGHSIGVRLRADGLALLLGIRNQQLRMRAGALQDRMRLRFDVFHRKW